jgi:hypothetical protein
MTKDSPKLEDSGTYRFEYDELNEDGTPKFLTLKRFSPRELRTRLGTLRQSLFLDWVRWFEDMNFARFKAMVDDLKLLLQAIGDSDSVRLAYLWFEDPDKVKNLGDLVYRILDAEGFLVPAGALPDEKEVKEMGEGELEHLGEISPESSHPTSIAPCGSPAATPCGGDESSPGM